MAFVNTGISTTLSFPGNYQLSGISRIAIIVLGPVGSYAYVTFRLLDSTNNIEIGSSRVMGIYVQSTMINVQIGAQASSPIGPVNYSTGIGNTIVELQYEAISTGGAEILGVSIENDANGVSFLSHNTLSLYE